eukprot:TRINITY_DN14464_c0_g1_i1.p1 TRINITY_DN14464_c0_g1~~TRINITY_DN14464_c0_g1_i1.p1  ORF type:complete len:330 (-),score=56.12 TRINITY_DN14464_c0_g1_i1:63-1019(-)
MASTNRGTGDVTGGHKVLGNPTFKRGGYGSVGVQSVVFGALVSVVLMTVAPLQEIPLPYAFASAISLLIFTAVASLTTAFGYFIRLELVENLQHIQNLTSTAVQGFVVGFVGVFSSAFAVGRVFGATPFWVHLIFRAIFHFMEFFLTALYHPESVSDESFLLNHSPAFHVASVVSLVEFWTEASFFPGLKKHPWISIFGVFLCSGGQFFRTGAMFQAAHNFTHLVATSKANKHKLVTDGFYSIVRHPAYFGWFWWSIGTQIILVNPICIVGYTWASWKFFANRIPFEEDHLRSFFGNEYARYAERVPILIPFIPTSSK